jgi:hypothetical protein
MHATDLAARPPGPDAAAIVALWEAADALPPGEFAVLLAAHADPGRSLADCADLPVGERDRAILGLRARTLGPRLQARADCPACAEPLELDLAAADLHAPPAVAEATLERGPLRLRVRPPSTRDLAAAARAADPGAALLAACVASETCPLDHVPADLRAEAVAAMAACDPQSDVQLALACPACGHAWTVGFDIVPFFARELAAAAARLLREVHVLARAYGWREAEILGLSPARRQRYLEMVGACETT